MRTLALSLLNALRSATAKIEPERKARVNIMCVPERVLTSILKRYLKDSLLFFGGEGRYTTQNPADFNVAICSGLILWIDTESL